MTRGSSEPPLGPSIDLCVSDIYMDICILPEQSSKVNSPCTPKLGSVQARGFSHQGYCRLFAELSNMGGNISSGTWAALVHGLWYMGLDRFLSEGSPLPEELAAAAAEEACPAAAAAAAAADPWPEVPVCRTIKPQYLTKARWNQCVVWTTC